MKTKRRWAQDGIDRPEIRPKFFPLYHACLENANSLLEEAELLLEHGHHARAFTLAFTAYEEIGKSQVVADYITDVAFKDEFKAAFENHIMKAAYVTRVVSLSGNIPARATIEYNTQDVQDFYKTRLRSLYVDHDEEMSPIEPHETVDPKMAENLIKAVREEIDFIDYAAWLNQRIGSKGLFK